MWAIKTHSDKLGKPQKGQPTTRFPKFSRAYLAGLMDGEGSISIYYRNIGQKHYFVPVVKIGMTYTELIQFLRGKYGGHLYWRKTQPYHKPLLTLALTGKKVLPILEDIYPFLIVKREQAKIVFEFFSGQMAQSEWHSQTMPAEEWARRKKLHQRIRMLNQRGISCREQVSGAAKAVCDVPTSGYKDETGEIGRNDLSE